MTFLLNAIVFLIIGLQLGVILPAIHTLTLSSLLLSALELSLALVVLRIVWVYPGAYCAWFLRTRVLKQNEPRPELKSVFVVGWTGMRGVVSLAAMLSVPATLGNGKAFPERPTLIFLTFSVILFTLVVQGLSLPPLISFLHLQGAENESPAEHRARRAMVQAALRQIEELREQDHGKFDAVYDALSSIYEQRLRVVRKEDESGEDAGWSDEADRTFRLVSQKVRDGERDVVVNWRKRGEISAGLRRKLERELDLLDARFSLEDE